MSWQFSKVLKKSPKLVVFVTVCIGGWKITCFLTFGGTMLRVRFKWISNSVYGMSGMYYRREPIFEPQRGIITSLGLETARNWPDFWGEKGGVKKWRFQQNWNCGKTVPNWAKPSSRGQSRMNVGRFNTPDVCFCHLEHFGIWTQTGPLIFGRPHPPKNS